MPAKKHIKSRLVNLMPQEGLTSTTSGRVLLWVLSTFRVILIVTEIFVIGSFISRFWLDAKNTDLSQEMKEKKAVIASLSEFEKDFKDVQNRLTLYDTYKKENGVVVSNIQTFVSYKPTGVFFKQVTADTSKIALTARSVNEFFVQQYLVNLKSSGVYEDVSLSNVALVKDSTELDFSLSVNIKK